MKPLRDNVHVWYCQIQSPEAWCAVEFVLSMEEITAGQRRHDKASKTRYWLAHSCIRLLIGHYINVDPRHISFQKNSFGKPRVVGHDISFSVSYTSNCFAIAFSKSGELGVDIEWLNPGFDFFPVATRFFGDDEIRLILCEEPTHQRRSFFEIHTLKEAYSKAQGEGLSFDRERYEFHKNPHAPQSRLCVDSEVSCINDKWSFHAVYLDLDLVASLAIDKPAPVCIETFQLTQDMYSQLIKRLQEY